MAIAQLSIDLTAKIAAFEAEMKRATDLAEQQSAKIASAIGTVKTVFATLGAGLAVGQITSLVTSTAEYADGLGKLAQKAGVTTEAMSALAYAGRQADVDQDTLAKGLRELGEDAAKGGKGLKALGISITDASGQIKTSDKLLEDLADVIAGIEDPAMRSAVAMKVLGSKVGPELIPLLSDGSQAIRDLTDEARKFGRVVDDEAAARAAKFNDNMQKFSEMVTAAGQTLGNNLLPILTDLSDALVTAAKHADGLWEGLSMVGRTRMGLGGLSMGTVVADLKDVRGELERIQERRDRFIRLGINTDGVDEELASAKRRLEYLKELQRGLVDISKGDESSAESRRLGLTQYRAPFRLPTEDTGAKKTPKATEHDNAAQALSSYVQQLDKQVQATQQLSAVEEARNMLKSLGATGEIAQVQELVLGLAQQKDAAEALKLAEKDRADEIAFRRSLIVQEGEAINQANTAWQNYLQSLDDQTPDGRLEKQRKLMADLAAEFEAGRSTAEQFAQRAQVALGTLPKDIKDADDAAKQLGLTFSSAFEDAIVKGSSLKDLVKSLGQDILRIAVRKAVTEPIGKALGGFFEKLFSFDGGGYTGNGPRSGGLDGKGGYLAMLHPQETVVDHTKGQTVRGGGTVVVTQNFSFGNGSNRSEVMTAATLGASMARQQIRDDMARGRL